MSHEKQLRNPKYRNWVKAGLGLKYLKEGLEHFTMDILDEQHQAILMTVKKSSKSKATHCHDCQLKYLLPNHCRTKSSHCPMCVNDCNCRHPKGKQTCPNEICSAIYDQIILIHASTPPSPNWRNTDSTLWCSNPWEIAKCFISAQGYAHTTSVRDTDCAGLLHIIVNNKGYHSHLQCHINGSDIFCKTRQYRNDLLHSATMELEKEISDQYIDDMIAVLQDPKELGSRPEAKEAVKKLTELKQKNFSISTDSEVELIQEMRKTTSESLDKIEAITNDHIDNIQGKVQNAENAVQQARAKAITEIEASQNNIQSKYTIYLDEKAKNIMESIESCASLQEERTIQRIQNAANDLSLSNTESLHVLKNESIDLPDKHTAQPEKKFEESNHTVSEKQEYAVRSLEKKRVKHDLHLKSMSFTELHEQRELLDYTSQQEQSEETDDLQQLVLVHKQTDYERMKKEFKKRLISLYMETVVRTSALPLHPDRNEASINDLYVEPWLKREEMTCDDLTVKKVDITGNSSLRCNRISSFHDIFCKDGKSAKLIYIIGEAGSGKSAFCKNMIHKWCLSHSEKEEIKTLQRKRSIIDEEMADEDIMKSFEFLFYISLRHNADSGDIKTMLNNNYEDPVLNDILGRESRTCLILIDGLDEWKPPSEERVSQFQTSGLPKRDHLKQYTILSTSRPWKVEVLKISNSEIDNKIRLCGIDYKSVVKMATNIVNHLNKTFKKKKSANRFLAKYVLSSEGNKTPLNDLMKSPMMLQQLVCLWFEDRLHLSSRCNIYISMLELSLEWSILRDPEDRLSQMFREKSVETEEVNLPLAFDEDSVCEEFKYIMLTAGKVAYHMLFAEQKETSLTFRPSNIRKYGVNQDFIQCCLNIGLFTEEQNVTFSLSKRRQCHLSFTHKSIQEVLAAVYIVSQSETSGIVAKENGSKWNISKYLTTVKTTEDVLEQSNVIELLSGLNPFLAEATSEYIFNIVNRDQRFTEFRGTLKDWFDCNIIVQIQELIFECIKEFHSKEGYEDNDLFLADVMIKNKADIPLLKKIKSESVKSILIVGEIWGLSRSSIHLSDSDIRVLCNMINTCSSSLLRFSKKDSITADAMEELPIYTSLISTQFNMIETLELNEIRLPHDKMVRLLTFVEHNTTLHVLSLKHLRCQERHCDMHDANLSELSKLNSIDLTDTDIRMTGLNTESLKKCVLIGMERYGSIDHLLSRAQVLEIIHLSSWKFISDSQRFLSGMQRITSIKISEIQMDETNWRMLIDSLKNCHSLRELSLISLIIPDKLKATVMSDIEEVHKVEKLELKDINISLRFAKDTLKYLIIDNVKCFGTDVSEFVKSLHYLRFLQDFRLENMDFQNSSFALPANLISLKRIVLQNVKLKRETFEQFSVSLHQLKQLETLQFANLIIPDGSLCFSSDMLNLRKISFEKVMMSLESWREMADDLSSLPQSVEVQTVDLYIEKGSLEAAVEYVKKNKALFHVSLSFGVDCNFRTIKNSGIS